MINPINAYHDTMLGEIWPRRVVQVLQSISQVWRDYSQVGQVDVQLGEGPGQSGPGPVGRYFLELGRVVQLVGRIRGVCLIALAEQSFSSIRVLLFFNGTGL